RMDAGWHPPSPCVFAPPARQESTRLRAAGLGQRAAGAASRGGGHGRRRSASAARTGARPPNDRVLESEKSVLACRAIYEGRFDRVLPGSVALDPALSARTPRRDDAFPRRDRWQVVLSEGRTGVRAEVGRDGPHLERRHAA